LFGVFAAAELLTPRRWDGIKAETYSGRHKVLEHLTMQICFQIRSFLRFFREMWFFIYLPLKTVFFSVPETTRKPYKQRKNNGLIVRRGYREPNHS
jgi:hypothetical protein